MGITMDPELDLASFWVSELPVTLEERMYRWLHETIVSGRLAPGTPLVSSRLAERLGVSRITVGNAMRRLASEGFVVIAPHRPATVAALDVATLREIFLIRHALEAEIMVTAARRIEPATIRQLRALDDRIRQRVLANEPEAYRELERDFHLLIYAAAELPLMASLLTDLWHRLEPYRGRRYSAHALAVESIDDHRAIITALEQRDGDSAARAMHTHVERGFLHFLAVLDATVSETPPTRAATSRPGRERAAASIGRGSLREALALLPDRRRPQGKMHRNDAVLVLAVCAALCGARSQYAVARWSEQCHPSIRRVLGLPATHGPSRATINRVIRGVDRAEFVTALQGWLNERDVEIPAIDRTPVERLHGLHGEEMPGIHLLAALAAHLRLVLTDDRGGGDELLSALLAGDQATQDVLLAELELRQAILAQHAAESPSRRGSSIHQSATIIVTAPHEGA